LPNPPPPTVRAAVQQRPAAPPPAPQSAAAQPAAAQPATVGPQLTPVSQPAAAPAATQPAASQQTTPAPPVLASARPSAHSPAPEQAAAQQVVARPPEPTPAASQPVLVASLDTAAGTPPQQTTTEPAPRPSLSISPPATAKPVSLADAFAEFTTKDAPVSTARTDAVDITKIQPARPAPKVEARPPVKAKPKPPANPSRVWVQVGTGRDVKALAFTWRRLQKEGGTLLAKHSAYSARWGATRRLITGPYKSEDEAQAAVRALEKKGLDAFQFTSDEGEEVTPLK
jgi:hypothetical protein